MSVENKLEMDQMDQVVVSLHGDIAAAARELDENRDDDGCGNCFYHGFPCLNCAETVYEGTRGPGFSGGVRTLLPNITSEAVLDAMVTWAEENNVEYDVDMRTFNHDDNDNDTS